MKITEKFLSVQGEGKNTGKICTWIRTFGCQLQCAGFGQQNPMDSKTWKPQFDSTIDLRSIKRIEDLPLPVTGCDSSFSWSARFKNLYPDLPPTDHAKEILKLLKDGKFNNVGHVFTGGEPMLQQSGISDIIEYWKTIDNVPAWIGIETNGTKKLENSLLIKQIESFTEIDKHSFYFSISPKLQSVSGELPHKAQKPDIVASYIDIAPESYLKFVVNDTELCWEEMNNFISKVKQYTDKKFDIYVMPMGATIEQQEEKNYVSKIADKAISYGYNVSLRAHVLIWGNDQVGR